MWMSAFEHPGVSEECRHKTCKQPYLHSRGLTTLTREIILIWAFYLPSHLRLVLNLGAFFFFFFFSFFRVAQNFEKIQNLGEKIAPFKSYLPFNPCPANPRYAFANSVDTDQLVFEEANWSGAALFAIQCLNLYQQPGSNKLIGWKLDVGVAS